MYKNRVENNLTFFETPGFYFFPKLRDSAENIVEKFKIYMLLGKWRGISEKKFLIIFLNIYLFYYGGL